MRPRQLIERSPMALARLWQGCLALALLALPACGGDQVAGEPAYRDNSPAGVHSRILVLDGWLGAGPMPCSGEADQLLPQWIDQGVDSGVWWVRSQAELQSAKCWLATHRGRVRLATRAGDAPRLHTAGVRSIYLGVLESDVGELDTLYRNGVRFARAPAERAGPWLAEARRLGLAIDVADVPSAITSSLLAAEGPPLVYGWRDGSAAPSTETVRAIARRGGVLMPLPGTGAGVVEEDLRDCLAYVRWDHCAISGAGDPQALTAALLGSGLSEGNVARMFGFDLLRVLRKAEIWAGQR